MRHSNSKTLNDHRSLLRKKLRSERSALPAQTRAGYDRAIVEHVSALAASRQATSIACFFPFNGEPDLTPVYKEWLADGCELALPVVSGDDDHLMRFQAWRTGSTLVENRYGIPEPLETEPVSLSGFDMLIMPLVGYDRLGNRLGMGSGYYDRHLELLRDSDALLRVGVAYSLQEIEPMNKNNWDIPLHGVVNEHGWFTFVS